MIPLHFYLYWSDHPMSYLRFLTFKTLRHFNPDAKITLYVSPVCTDNNYKWCREKLEFEHPDKVGKNYINDLRKLGVEIIYEELFPNFAPNYQSDLFRWWVLSERGGFYLDTDQIIVKAWDTLPLEKDFIYCSYIHPMHGLYCPVGVLGASKYSTIAKKIHRDIMKFYNPNDYNSLGPNMFIKMQSQLDLSNAFNAPMSYFYPSGLSDLCWQFFSGQRPIYPELNYAVHWFGAHPESQKFNAMYTEDFAKQSKDSISVFLRKSGLA